MRLISAFGRIVLDSNCATATYPYYVFDVVRDIDSALPPILVSLCRAAPTLLDDIPKKGRKMVCGGACMSRGTIVLAQLICVCGCGCGCGASTDGSVQESDFENFQPR